MSSSFRDRPSLSERMRGKSTEELIQEMKNSMDESKKKFFNKPRPSWFGSSATSSRRFPFDDESGDLDSHLDRLAEEHPDIAEPLRTWRNDKSTNKKKRTEDLGREGKRDDEEARGEPEQSQGRESSSAGDQGQPLRTNLRNTVPDMQQRKVQEEEERGNRSQSAPPSQSDTCSGSGCSGGSQSHPHTHSREPVVRHIPIFVEGRDEPVLPKDMVDSSFPREKRNVSRETSPVPPSRRTTAHLPEAKVHNQQQSRPQHQSSVHINRTPPQPQDKQIPVDIKINTEPIVVPLPPPPAPTPPKKPPLKLGPLEKVQLVQQEVTSLMKQVEEFNGNSRSDKNYVYLDEMLTRNLLKLDDIETEGKEDVRAARKGAIRDIQKCISQLESKAPLSNSTGRENTPDTTSEIRQDDALPDSTTSVTQQLALQAFPDSTTEQANPS